MDISTLKYFEQTLEELNFSMVWKNHYTLNDFSYGCECILFNERMGLITYMNGRKLRRYQDDFYFSFGKLYGEGIRNTKKLPYPLTLNITLIDRKRNQNSILKMPPKVVDYPEHFELDINMNLKTNIKRIKQCFRLNSRWQNALPYEKFYMVSEKDIQCEGWQNEILDIVKKKILSCPIELRRIFNPNLP